MTAVPRVTGSKLLVQIGNGANPEVFDHDCLINTKRGVQFSSEKTESIMPDCDNPDDPAWKSVSKDGFQATISGAGMLYAASLGDWWDWYNSDDAKNVRFNVTPAGYWQGAFKLTDFEVTADGNKDTATTTVTIVSDGAVVWVPVP
ncbi:phage tail tube protein [Mesorhizobium sp.]|uniref:phage tail tube protein n=1 Tax=Mesorhizobium sp. TaxID=1871066 RepID=UPI003BAA7F1F